MNNDQLDAIVSDLDEGLDEAELYPREREDFARKVITAVKDYVQTLGAQAPSGEAAHLEQLTEKANDNVLAGRSNTLPQVLSAFPGALESTDEAERTRFLEGFLRAMIRYAQDNDVRADKGREERHYSGLVDVIRNW